MNGSQFPTLRQVDAVERLGLQALAAITATPLSHQLELLRATSPYYRSRITDTRAVHADEVFDTLATWPFTTKSDVLDEQGDHGPFGQFDTQPRDVIRRVHQTSGTSGLPITIALTQRDIEDTIMCGARCFRAAGVRPGMLVIHCLNYCLWAGGYTDHQSLERAEAAVVPFGVGHSRRLIETIRQLRPQAIHCTPSYLASLELILANDYQATPDSLGLSLGLFGGEGGLQHPGFRARIESTWGFRAMNANYGLSEVLSMCGAECTERDGLHFMGQEVVHPELAEPHGTATRPIRQGAEGELVLTHIRRDIQPLVRYRTGDVIRIISTEPCACGRGSFRFSVVGRRDDMLVVRGVNVFPSTIAGVLTDFGPRLTGEYRIDVSRIDPISRIVVTVETDQASNTHSDLASALAEALERRLHVRPHVALLPPGGLPRTEGKTRRVLRVLD